METILVLTILALAVLLFATEWIRMDMVSLLVLLSLGLLELVSVEEAFSGFSNPAVITVAAMFVISSGVSSTGALSRVGQHLTKLAKGSESRLTVIIMLTVAFFSSFINNIGSTALLMPVVINICRRLKLSPSRLLIPLAYGSLLGGVCTLVGTPPNILMNTLLEQHTGETFKLFDFTPLGLVIVTAGILYMVLVGRHLLPIRKSGSLTESYQVKEYIAEVEIISPSPLAGLTIAASGIERDFGMRVRGILRDNRKIPHPHRNNKLREGDTLFLEGNPEGILKVSKAKGLEIVPERDNPQVEGNEKEMVVVEASLTPNSEMAGKTLKDLRFRETHGLNVLALWRRGAPVVKKVAQVELEFGDVLLLQGPEQRVIHLGKNHGFLVLGGVPPIQYRPRKAPIALCTLLGVITLATLGLPIMISATLGAWILVLSRCITPQEAYESIDWKIIILIAGTLPLGIALEKSGAAALLAGFLTDNLGHFGPLVLLAAIVLSTSILTEVMSHAATAVLIAPIAFNTALALGVSPKPFFMAVAMAASSCFMTPISHQSNALVMGPGGYRFFDYTRVGAPLNLLTLILITLLVPLFFPF